MNKYSLVALVATTLALAAYEANAIHQPTFYNQRAHSTSSSSSSNSTDKPAEKKEETPAQKFDEVVNAKTTTNVTTEARLTDEELAKLFLAKQLNANGNWETTLSISDNKGNPVESTLVIRKKGNFFTEFRRSNPIWSLILEGAAFVTLTAGAIIGLNGIFSNLSNCSSDESDY